MRGHLGPEGADDLCASSYSSGASHRARGSRLGDGQKAAHWLSTPLALFENQTPTDLLATDEGVALVERTLTRIEHNIPS